MIGQFFDWPTITRALPRLLAEGLRNTLLVAFLAIIVGLMIGVLMAALLLSKRWWVRLPAQAYVGVLRSLPVVLVVMLIGVGLPAAGLRPFGREAFGYAVLAIGVVSGAYVADIVRSGILSVEPSQVHAARMDGGTPLQAMWLVVVPQAVQRCLPALAGQFVRDVKESSLVYVLGLGIGQRELFFIAQEEAARTNNASPLVAAGACYLAITLPLTFLVARATRRRDSRASRLPAYRPISMRLGAYR
ncbi:amino acid ABC transporter permease [Actinoplanes sp. ATCC 53533]|uniref:amino acid ABC transporter permease n=1 Tax=Actinoplanes sp. ATCC 53533 TaxID=1288362 RepID=UPI0018F449CA|nr:amino acid ABC transporter permease [Actinoplanes sp. ATCC 53533]